MAGASLKLFLCGDVMTGRGIDQVLPHPSLPHLREPYVGSALGYVRLAERACGPVPRRVAWEYVWGEALAVLARERPDARIVNLETAVTTSEDAAAKGIHYRMHPANLPVLLAAGVDCAGLANNHVMDWGRAGLLDTLEALAGAGIAGAGAGRDLDAARAPAALAAAGGRVLVFACGGPDCGIPTEWAAGDAAPGVHRLPDYSARTVKYVVRWVRAHKRAGDVAVVSIHWGGNWGYEVPAEHRSFARALADHGGVDVVHGHSSHHPRAAEVYRGRLILYGCGEMVNDYEGITGHEAFRSDLVLMYFPTLEAETGRLLALELVPLRLRGFRLVAPSAAERGWLHRTLGREYARFGARLSLRDERLALVLD